MILATLLAELENKGVRLWPDDGQLSIQAPKGALTAELREGLVHYKAQILDLLTRYDGAGATGSLPQLVPDPAQRFSPFPLTDIQQAYWIGRTSAFELGNVSIHMYWELERSGLDLPRLEHAWNQVVERHDMLRSVVLADGRMRILEHVPVYRIATLDLRGKEPWVQAQELDSVRSRLSHQVLAIDQWPGFEIQASLLDGGRIRLHISIDLVSIDASSLLVLFRDWVHFYRGTEDSLAPLDLSFRDYVLAEGGLRESKAYARSLEYWHKRAAVLPPAPDLPLARTPDSLSHPRFSRRTARLEPEAWQRLKTMAAELGVTTSAVLLTAYAEILRCWGTTPDFTINVTLFNRLPLHPRVNDILGHFTSMILLEVAAAPGTTFEERVKRLQKRLWTDLEYNQSSGVESLRELARIRHKATGAIMPMVFTSLLSHGPGAAQTSLTDVSELGEVIYEITQTPQVWLDHQVFEEAGALVFNWDGIEELFPPGMLDSMFGAYCRLVRSVAGGQSWQDTAPQLIPPEQIAQREAMNATNAPFPSALLQTLFEANARQRPDWRAVITAQRTITYAELDRISNRIGHRLRDLNVRPNTLVAVVMKKGWEQVAAVLGILKSGAAYLPVDADFPRERIRFLIENGEAAVALLQSSVGPQPDLPDSVRGICVGFEELADVDDSPLEPVQTPADLAYVIFTSGSTGKPKGVMIDHRSVVNRMIDCAKRFDLKPEDSALAVSALHHDLSVFDIFGVLAVAGGSIVVPDAESIRDPAHWAELMGGGRVTVWNSVPTFMRMLVEHLENRRGGQVVPGSLRLVILSGEFIPVDLPDRLRELSPGTVVVSGGGSTETTVWDICYPIGEVDPAWKSIPYGRPMANAQYHILKDTLEPCPVWVPGELYMGGSAGLALGYWRDPERTSARFITHPLTGQRLYRSGDMGRYLPDGNIEILGRRDLQVKIRGNRIELGEIEAALALHPAVRTAVVCALGAATERNRLVAYVVPAQAPPAQGKSASLANEEWLRQFSDSPLDGVIRDPIDRLDFLLKQRQPPKEAQEESCIQLLKPEPAASTEAAYAQRRSHRAFLTEPIPFREFSAFLGCLREVQIEGSFLAKYRYPSAGGLYPVRTYLYVAPGRVEGLQAGTYFYDPRRHHLKTLSADAHLDRAAHAPPNRSIFDSSAFSVFLIGDLDAIEPMYGDMARDFSVLEAGYVGQLLMSSAREFGIGVCPIGGLDFTAVRESLRLSDRQIYLHSLLGGPIGTAGSAEAHPAQTVTADALIAGLRRFLSDKLPDYMVPSAFVLLESLPLTDSGKVDRAVLPSPEAAQRVSVPRQDAPETAMERVVTEILRELLPGESIGIHDSFFDLGANSMDMVRLANKLKETLNREISVLNMFKYPSIALLAEYLSEDAVPASFDEIDARAKKQIEAAQRRKKKIGTA